MSARGDKAAECITVTNALVSRMVALSSELIKKSYEELAGCDGMVLELDAAIASLEPYVGTDVEDDSIEW